MYNINWNKINNIEINENEVHLWKMNAIEAPTKIKALKKILSDAEKSKSEKFRFDKDRFSYITAHSLLRILISKYIHIPAEKIVLKNNQYGKPKLLFPQNTNLNFNVSHSHNKILIGFTLKEEIGVDIEKMREMDKDFSILFHFFSETEKKEFNEIPDEKKLEAFFFMWTCKEAFIKAKGEGLKIPLSSFSITRSLTDEVKLILSSKKEKDWNIKNFLSELNFPSSVVVSGQMPDFYFFDAVRILDYILQ